VCFTFALLLAGAVARPALADHDHDHAAAPAGGAVKAEIIRQLDEAEEKLVALANATPAEKLGWKPGEKVRSTGEVFLHVAGGNYFLASLAGTKVPDGVNMKDMEKNAGDKAVVIDTLKKSFDHVRKMIQAASDADLEKKVKIFDHEGTVREVYLLLATHAHEHLGQSIAYARMNGITPPWSA
jgi:uncharacterized damage-inducible protein DinB